MEAKYKERFETIKQYVVDYGRYVSQDAAIGCLVTWAYYEGKTEEDADYKELADLCGVK